MKKLSSTILLMLIVSFLYSQRSDLPTLKGPAILIGSWEGGKKTPITFTSSAQDNFRIYQGQQGMMLTVSYKNTSELLEQIDGPDDGFIRVYEFDFGNQRDREFIVFSHDARNTNCRIYKISKGLVKIIGNFKPAFEVVVSKDMISFPYGGQGFSNDFYFKDDAFFELIYHNPQIR
jgi:hypothetical protein